MTDQRIITPYFLDQRLPALEVLAGPKDRLITPALADGDIQDRMSSIHAAIADAVEHALRSGLRPVCISGDCCSTIGVAAGLQRGDVDPFLIWFDAHGDFNTWETTPSGFLGGMPLAMLVGRGEQRMLESVRLRPLQERRVILTDARDLDAGEREAVAGSELMHLERVTELIDILPSDKPIYVHFDTDVVNPADAPGMNYLAPGGARAEELGHLFRILAETGRIEAISMSSWNPELDQDGRTAASCMHLLDQLKGDG